MLSPAERQAMDFTAGLHCPPPVVNFAASHAEALAGYSVPL
ncbi:MAG: hypothetical protein WBQ37_07465 [Candidatus Competibacter sp.]